MIMCTLNKLRRMNASSMLKHLLTVQLAHAPENHGLVTAWLKAKELINVLGD